MDRSRLSLLFGLAMFGCAVEAPSDADAVGEEDITGLRELSSVEQQLSLTRDERTGREYDRSDAQLKAGPCYQKTIGTKSGDAYEFRRYTDGAAFFRRRGTEPGTGDERPVACIDLDAGVDSNGPTVEIGRFELDMIMRYRLGRERTTETREFWTLTRLDRGTLELFTSAGRGGDTLSTPRVRGDILAKLQLGADRTLSGTLARVVYEYAWKSAKAADRFIVSDDPVGEFDSIAYEDSAEGPRITHARFLRLDAHEIVTKATATAPAIESLYITPKLSDDAVEMRAIVQCSRPIDPHDTMVGPATNDFYCEGL
jgi:hypothetical protein